MNTNTTPEKIQEAIAQNRRRASCPTCGAHRDREHTSMELSERIVEWLRETNITRRESCLKCVEKHLGYAKALFRETLALADAPKGNAMLNHIEIVGELRAATEEASAHEALYQALLAAERDYRYEGVEPDWLALATLLTQAQ